MNRVSAGFIHRLAGADVAGEVALGQPLHHDPRALRASVFEPRRGGGFPRPHQTHAGDDFVSAPGKQTEHARRIRRVLRLAEHESVHHDDRIRGEHEIMRPPAGHSVRLFSRQAFGTVFRRLAREWNLRHTRRLHRERNIRVAQEFLAAWRSRSQNQHRIQSLPPSVKPGFLQDRINSMRLPNGS